MYLINHTYHQSSLETLECLGYTRSALWGQDSDLGTVTPSLVMKAWRDHLELPTSSKSSVDTGSIPECEIWKDQKSCKKYHHFWEWMLYLYASNNYFGNLLQKKLAAPMNRCYKLNFECSYMVYQRWTSECMASQSIQFHTNCWLTTPLILVGTPTFLHLNFGQSRSGWVPQLSFYLTNVFLWIGNIHIPTVCG